MNYTFCEISYPSTDGVHTVHAGLYLPTSGDVRGVVQLAHGMIDHIGRYTRLADALAQSGFILAGNDHLGHGKSVNSRDELGFFSDKDSVGLLLSDMYKLNSMLHERYPTLPVIILGHSMGSFLARLYVQRHSESVRGAVFLGTGGKNPLLPMGRALTSLVILTKGARHRSRLIEKLAFGSYNARFPRSEGADAWLTRDTEILSEIAKDELRDFKFTSAGYRALFSMLAAVNSDKWFSEYPKRLPTLIMSGGDDPVGDYSRGVGSVYKRLMTAGASDASLKIYAGARHELFNETNREEFFADLSAWLEKIK